MIFLEKVAREARIHIIDARAVDHQIAKHSHERQYGAVSHHSEHSGQHDERAEHGHDSARDGYDYGRRACQAKSCHYRIGQQCVGRKHRRQQCGLGQLHPQHEYGHGGSDDQGDAEGEQAEYKPFRQIFLQVIHVYLDACEKHQIEQSDLSEHLETHILVEQSESVRTHSHAGKYQTDDVGYLQPVEQKRSHKYDGHYRQKYRHRVGDKRRARKDSSKECHSECKITQNTPYFQ